MFLAHGTTLALVWFLAINALASAAVVIVAARRIPRTGSVLLALRLLPAAASIAFVAIAFVPSYWRFEPRDFVEGFDVTLTAAAALAAAVLVLAAGRAISAWRGAARRARAWNRLATPLTLDNFDLPAFVIEHSQPVMALAGILRPRLILTRGLLDVLTPEEIAAGAAHELAHDRGRDNLKRLAMRGAPELLHWTRTAHLLERRWAAAAEHTADAAAAIAGNRAARFALASALVKVARLMPAAPSLGEPISTLVDGGEIAARVERLLDDRPAAAVRRTISAPWMLLGAAALASAFVAGYVPLLEAVHHVTEVLVQSLP
jgi:beta-lactamase regulating signal transducer with metallopeptidase domain